VTRLLAFGLAVAAAIAAAVLLVTSPWGSDPEPEPAAVGPVSLTLRIMSFNIFYGGDELDLSTDDWCTKPTGCQEAFAQVLAAIRESGADVVGLQEPTGNTRAVAEELGWHFNERTHVISRFPIVDPPGADGDYVFVEAEPGRVVAVANVHLPSSPYGPYRLRDGVSHDEVIALEERVRLPAIQEQLSALEELATRGIPAFLTGDFNSPSHLDWTEAADDARDDMPFPVEWPVSKALAAAGFFDSYRSVNPDPVAEPGFTWTPGGPESVKREVHDRIDWVLAGGPVEATASRVVGEAGNASVDLEVDPWPSDHRGVVSTFDMTPAEMPALVAVGSRLVEQPDALEARFHGTGEEGERTAILRPGESFEAALASQPTSGADGTLELDTEPLAPGTYDAALVDPDGAVVARSEFWLYGPGTEPTVTTTKRRYTTGEPIEVSWTKAPGMKFDWLSIFKARRGPGPPQENCSAGVCGNGTYLLYEYTGAEVEGTTAFDAGSEVGYATWPLEPGTYEVRLLLDDGYRSVATSPTFKIVKR
jgi:endonuclease/exonuclease/phosphatase family metal-dependent hydrolase